MKSSSLVSMVESWSKSEAFVNCESVDPHNNSLKLSNGKTFTYKALVLAPGLNQSMDHIPGLRQMSETPESDLVFVHELDLLRYKRNAWMGYQNRYGDMLCYSPKTPYKGEGCDFYALYFEHLLRDALTLGYASNGARIQFWTPNKEIYQFPYANEVVLDECQKRGIDVYFGWEMIEVKKNHLNEKIAVFKNVDSGEVIEKDFESMSINPASKPHEWLSTSGLTDDKGMIDVNKYTL